ncbi:MAG: hypothetical protein RXQ62_07300 [Nitrososphaeria archaeon]
MATFAALRAATMESTIRGTASLGWAPPRIASMYCDKNSRSALSMATLVGLAARYLGT